MTTLYLRLPVVVDDADPMRCSAECPQHDYLWSCEMPDEDDAPAGWRCRVYDEQGETDAKLNVRHPACVEATNAAAEHDASIARQAAGIAFAEQDAGSVPNEATRSLQRWADAITAGMETRKVKL